jgi:hypothetical protein
MKTKDGVVQATLWLSMVVYLSCSEPAIAQCPPAASEVAQSFVREFQTAPDWHTLQAVYERYISRERRFSFRQLEMLKGEIVNRFGARPDALFPEPDLVEERPFTASNARGAEVTLTAAYPQGRVTQVTRLVCEGGAWKVQGFEFGPG